MSQRNQRPAVAAVMNELVANRSRGYRVTHAQMMGLLVVLAEEDDTTIEEAAEWLEWPASLGVSLMQREYMNVLVDRVTRAFDEVMAMPLAPWVCAGGDAVFEPVLMVPAMARTRGKRR